MSFNPLCSFATSCCLCRVENLKHWPANATLLAMTYTDVYGVSRSVVLHNTSQPFGKVYYRPTLFSLMPYLHQTWTRDWLLNGTGLIGVKALTLMTTNENGVKPFDITTIADIISPFPLASNHLHLRLKPGKRWASGVDTAQIRVLNLDTGAGPVVPSHAVQWSEYQTARPPLVISVFPDPPASIPQ